MKIYFKLFLLNLFFLVFFLGNSHSKDILNKIVISGNERISSETIIVFADISLNQEITAQDTNLIIKKLYETNYFDNVNVKFNNETLLISVVENPIIGNLTIKGIKAEKIIDAIKKNLNLKRRSSFTNYLLKQDIDQILINLKDLGYYFANCEAYTEDRGNKIIDLTYNISLGEKAKIKKITFTGNKIFKNKELKNIIVSEEYRPWKFISGKKYLNENLIKLDNRLLKSFYLNNGFYDVRINSSFAKMISNNEFELVFNIVPGELYYFNDLSLILPNDYNKKNFEKIETLFNKIKNKPYSINSIDRILEEIDNLSIYEQFQSTKSSIEESFVENKINIKFIIEETQKVFVEKINIFGNNITRENVIRNQFELDEGDPFNEILFKKTINNLKSLNYFKTVSSKVVDGGDNNSKILNISVEEKPTGEITAGAGFGTSGGTILFGITENNYLGKGLNLTANATIREDSIKGVFRVKNPNYKNTDRSISTSIQSSEIDKLTDFGYKSNKTGFNIGTEFEYFDDLELGLGINSFYEKIETSSSASAQQKKQKGNYFDNHLNISFDYDKRNQKFKTTDGLKSFTSFDTPLISEKNTLVTTFIFDNYNKLFSSNVIKSSFYFQSSNSITGDDIKLSERLYLPAKRLRGFEYGKLGPKDGKDYIGGNFASAINISSTLPQLMPNSETTDFLMFLDMGNVWGVDYNSSLNNADDIRSSIGIGLDWFSVIGPMNFTLSQPITKNSSDKTETFTFNLGTTF